MKVLVTGASGFIGSRLTRALCERGEEVRVLARPQADLTHLSDLPLEVSDGDLTLADSLPPALAGVDTVFHAAAFLGSQEPEKQVRVNIAGTRALCAAALQAGVRRFVHTSSAAALGVPEPRVQQPFRETHTWDSSAGVYPYGWAKYQAELEVQTAVARGLDAVILNPSMVFGAGDLKRKKRSVLVALLRRKLPACLEGGLNAVHIDDVVAGHLAAWQHGERGRRYLLCGENLSWPQFFQLVEDLSGVPTPRMVIPGWMLRPLSPPARWLMRIFHFSLPLDLLSLAGRFFYYDSSDSIRALGLPPPRAAAEAIRSGLEWFTANP